MTSLRVARIVFALILLSGSLAAAGEWQIVGPRALGMGGANVAVADDATAAYWNPGAFGFFKNPEAGGDYGSRSWSAQLAAGLGAQTHEDLVQEVDRISKFDFDTLSGGPLTPNRVSEFIKLVDALRGFSENKNRAASILGDSGLRIQFGHLGIGVTGFVDVSSKGEIDLVNIAPDGSSGAFSIDEFTDPVKYGCTPCPSDPAGGLDAAQRAEINTHLTGLGWTGQQRTNYIDSMDNGFVAAGTTPTAQDVEQIKNVATTANLAAGTGGEISNNDSKLRFQGIGLVEVPLTYGREVKENLSIGGNLKYMKARVYDFALPVFREDFGDKLDQALDNYTDKSNFGIDLGGLYRFGDHLRFGLVVRNLNAPKFGSIKQNPQVRTGVAYKPLGFITLAADLDLTKNDTTVGGDFKSQNIAAGIEFRLIEILMLRGGLYRNLAENDIGLVYTLGFGLNLWVVNLDAGVAMSGDKTDFDGKDIPEELRGTFALSMLF